jgi:hypothetical protein
MVIGVPAVRLGVDDDDNDDNNNDNDDVDDDDNHDEDDNSDDEPDIRQVLVLSLSEQVRADVGGCCWRGVVAITMLDMTSLSLA